jgi:BASS family bile acid:Na+ symporter
VLLCLAFLRVEPGALRRRFARPAIVLAAVAWMMVATPLACGPLLAALGLDRGLLVALTLQVAAPPVVATSALAALMGLDAALALAVLTACAAATPATAAVFAALFLGGATDVSPLELGATTALVFWRAGRTAALTIALTAGLRNLGVMIAATGGRVPELTWLYIAMAQFPVYLLPHLFKAALARGGDAK